MGSPPLELGAGGHLDAKYPSMIQEIAETYGIGSCITTVRRLEIPGIRYEDMDKVNELPCSPSSRGLKITSRSRARGYSAPEHFRPVWQ